LYIISKLNPKNAKERQFEPQRRKKGQFEPQRRKERKKLNHRDTENTEKNKGKN